MSEETRSVEEIIAALAAERKEAHVKRLQEEFQAFRQRIALRTSGGGLPEGAILVSWVISELANLYATLDLEELSLRGEEAVDDGGE